MEKLTLKNKGFKTMYLSKKTKVDQEIIPLLKELRKFGIDTTGCCSGHPGGGRGNSKFDCGFISFNVESTNAIMTDPDGSITIFFKRDHLKGKQSIEFEYSRSTIPTDNLLQAVVSLAEHYSIEDICEVISTIKTNG
jgi:hypothetical protein